MFFRNHELRIESRIPTIVTVNLDFFHTMSLADALPPP
jgi:hypothetical protein